MSDRAGLASFTLNIMAGVWIKYTPFNSVSTAATVVMAIALAYLVQVSPFPSPLPPLPDCAELQGKGAVGES